MCEISSRKESRPSQCFTRNPTQSNEWFMAIRNGDRLALSRLLTQAENGTDIGLSALDELFQYTGKAHLIGITGAPGTGKSTITNQIAKNFRHPPSGLPAPSVAIVAVDPTSPFSGGAVLGDRVRMRDLAGDPGVFIRSMASRGASGGLSRSTSAVVQILDAAGFNIILIETVGAGQSEVEIDRLAHTTIVVETPSFGDDIQAIKAGTLEIADIVVVNKADMPGADRTEQILRSAFELASPTRAGGWTLPIIRTSASTGAGIPDLMDAITRHYDFLMRSDEWQLRSLKYVSAELTESLKVTLFNKWRSSIPDDRYHQILDALSKRLISPNDAILKLTEGR
jgi:LAO/AO transport system kinase